MTENSTDKAENTEQHTVYQVSGEQQNLLNRLLSGKITTAQYVQGLEKIAQKRP